MSFGPWAGLTRRALLLVTLALSWCSMVYELALAQSLAATLGDTFLRYNITIVLYLASLGLGALCCGRLAAGRELERLCAVELGLSAAGAAGPLAILAWDAWVYRAAAWAGLDPAGWACRLPLLAFDHGIIALVGVLSGFELPLLMRLGRAGRGAPGGAEVLAADYAGMLLGALTFPLILLPRAGLIPTALLTALVNVYCGLWLALLLPRPGLLRLAAYAGVAFGCLGLLAGRAPLHRAAMRVFIGQP